MPSAGVHTLAIQELVDRHQRAADRFVEIQLTVKHDDEVLLTVGGVWDSSERRYLARHDVGGHAATERVIAIHDGQREAFEWWLGWLRRYLSGDWDGVTRPYEALWFGPRRGGKTWLALLTALIFAVVRPRSLVWLIAPTDNKTDELRRALGGPEAFEGAFLPASWAQWKKDDGEFILANGSVLRMRSAYKSLREGKCDYAVCNEAQLWDKKRYDEVGGALVDVGGLRVACANPPDTAKGKWVEEMHFQLVAGKRPAACEHHFDPRLNPHIDLQALDALAATMDAQSRDRDILGLFVPVGDVVHHAFDAAINVRVIPDHFEDITAQYTRTLLGRAYDHVVGCDFDKLPHLAACIAKIYRDPARPAEPVVWILHGEIVPKSDENGLIDALEQLPGRDDPTRPMLDPRRTLIIADASGRTQSTTRQRGDDSWSYFKNRGWRYVSGPQPKRKDNPRIRDRCRLMNAALRTSDGRVFLYFVPDARDAWDAIREWENRNGAPYMKSVYAHMSAAVGYLVYRMLHKLLRPHTRDIDRASGGYEGRELDRESAALLSL